MGSFRGGGVAKALRVVAARLEALQASNERLEAEVVALRAEVGELRALQASEWGNGGAFLSGSGSWSFGAVRSGDFTHLLSPGISADFRVSDVLSGFMSYSRFYGIGFRSGAEGSPFIYQSFPLKKGVSPVFAGEDR